MDPVVRVGINGACGRMGRALLYLLESDTRFALLHAVVASDAGHRGLPVWPDQPAGLKYADDWTHCPALDVVIDFSSAQGFATALEFCLANAVALVSGTTGLDDAAENRLTQASLRVAILRAANFSAGLAVLTRLLKEAAASLPGWDLEIVEAHHGRKRDAPSGTALALGHAAAAARRTTLDAVAVYGHEGRAGERQNGSIGFAVIRGGDIVGEHTALLISHGERLELSHRATDRSIFARGALQAALWVSERGAGYWTMDDVIASPR